MAFNPIGVLDLSIVTELLVDTVTDYWPDAGLWTTLFSDAFFKPNISGLTPDAVRKLGGCQLSLSLIHIEPSKSQRNFVYPPTPPPYGSPRAQSLPSHPLGLDLYYFVSAFADGNAQQEQQAISIVLNCFHQSPILRKNVVFPGSPSETTREEFTLTMEIESVDSISRLWQAMTVPFRLSLMYRVAVVFMTPPAPPPPAKQVVKYGLAVEPTPLPPAANAQVFGTSSASTYVSPNNAAESVSVNYSPATVVPGQQFVLYGSGLNQGTGYTGPAPNPGNSHRVFLLSPPDYTTEQEVTTQWVVADPDPAHPEQTASRVILKLPATVGALPANAPAPGIYQLRVGSNKPQDAVTNRTNATPFSVAAKIDALGSPADVILPEVGGEYKVNGLGFVAGSTQVLLETIPLSAVSAGPLSAGEFLLTGDTAITFQRPANLASGTYAVRVLVNGVESAPGLWVKV